MACYFYNRILEPVAKGKLELCNLFVIAKEPSCTPVEPKQPNVEIIYVFSQII